MTIVFYVGYYATPWGPEDLDNTGLGGTEKCVCFLAKELSAAGHDVHVLGQVRPTNWNGVRFATGIDGVIDVLVGVQYIHFLKEFEYHSVRKTVFWLHNEEYFPWYRGEELADHRRYLSLVDHIVCVSDWHLKETRSRYPEVAHKCMRIYNGVPTKLFNRTTNKTPNSYVYTSHPERGLDKTYEYVKSVGGHLYVATPEYGLKMLRDSFRHLFDDESVTVLGTLPQKELYDLLSKMERWHYPTEYNETFCITALEMMAHGVIPETSLRAGLQETVGIMNKETDTDKLKKWVNNFDWSIIMKEWQKQILDREIPVFEKAYCICMNPDAGKEKDVKSRFRKLGINVPIEVIPGVDVSVLSDQQKDYEVYDSWAIDTKNTWWNRPVTPGEVGCALAHMSAWQKIIDDEVSAALVLEEDFEVLAPLNQDVIRDFDNPREWGVWYLGGNPIEPSVMDFDDAYIPGLIYNNHAYIVTSDAAKKLQSQPYRKNIIPVDEFLPATFVHSEHPRKDLHFFDRNIKAMASKQEIIKQTSTTETSQTSRFANDELFKTGDWDAWVERWIHPVARTKQWDLILDEPIDDLITYPLFTEEFCEAIMEEAEKNARWEKKRHDFYPTVDTLLSTFGFDDIYNRVLREFVYPAAIYFWHLDGNQWPSMNAENFMVKYTMDAQGHLNLHHDFSAITALLTLNRDFTGGGTYFSKQNKTHVGTIGEISIHPGAITHRHGGRPIHSGKRYIIVSFCNKP
jgi:glycosyltransferase involved in cell wall biosynthesis